MLKTALYNAMRIGSVVAPLAVVGYLGFDVGRTQTTRIYEAKLATQRASHAQDLQHIAETKAAELGQALTEQQRLTDQVHQLGWELIQTRARLADTQFQLKQRIADATRSDGPRFTGLGPDSLRLYRAVLGYPERDSGVPQADTGNADQAGQAGGTGEGLPPEDLLAHAADYGEWCQRLDAQLDTLINLYRKDGDGPV